MLKYSFTFGGVDMREKYGVWVVAEDTFLPKLREHKVTVPGRSGAYDYGSDEYDERELVLECDTRTGKTRQELREIAYLLSKKNRIALWREPDKYYIGRLYEDPELEDLGEVVYKFKLKFTCEPFAYGETVQAPAASVAYDGTAKTPTRLEITNIGSTDAVGITITVAERRDNL